MSDVRLFMIGVAAEMSGMHPQTLRMYERRGLVVPTRSAGGTRLYSYADVTRLRQIQELSEAGFNLIGIDRILELEREVERLRAQVREMESQARTDARAVPGVVHSVSTEIVIRRPSTPPAPIIHPVIQRRNQYGR